MFAAGRSAAEHGADALAPGLERVGRTSRVTGRTGCTAAFGGARRAYGADRWQKQTALRLSLGATLRPRGRPRKEPVRGTG